VASGAVLSFNQIQSLWIQNGGAPGWAPLAAAIAIAESGGNTVSLNNTPSTGDYSVGLWQINYYDGLMASRTASYGAPAQLQADPNLQAKAAIALSGNGSNWGPWKTDAAWNAWQAKGAPANPTVADLQSWGVPLGGAGGGTSSSATATGTGSSDSSNAGASGTGCSAKGKIFGVAGISFSYCQGKSLVGGLCVGAGGGIMLAGTMIVVAWGLGHTGAGKAAAGVVKGGGPIGMVAKAIT
jgi:hypothetical protein